MSFQASSLHELSFSGASGGIVAQRTINAGSGYLGFAAMNSSFFHDPSTVVPDSIDASSLVTAPNQTPSGPSSSLEAATPVARP